MNFRGVAQLASVLAWGASGRPFESGHPDLIRARVGAIASTLDLILKPHTHTHTYSMAVNE